MKLVVGAFALASLAAASFATSADARPRHHGWGQGGHQMRWGHPGGHYGWSRGRHHGRWGHDRRG